MPPCGPCQGVTLANKPCRRKAYCNIGCSLFCGSHAGEYSRGKCVDIKQLVQQTESLVENLTTKPESLALEIDNINDQLDQLLVLQIQIKASKNKQATLISAINDYQHFLTDLLNNQSSILE